ncbi:MAG: hypothetical protein OXH00_13650 [Candidatus Poribacteria bacterium]|nr:hypothetical protein [Candidatus Poribacteria bacterium]
MSKSWIIAGDTDFADHVDCSRFLHSGRLNSSGRHLYGNASVHSSDRQPLDVGFRYAYLFGCGIEGRDASRKL